MQRTEYTTLRKQYVYLCAMTHVHMVDHSVLLIDPVHLAKTQDIGKTRDGQNYIDKTRDGLCQRYFASRDPFDRRDLCSQGMPMRAP